jgi:hypothetical protein
MTGGGIFESESMDTDHHLVDLDRSTTILWRTSTGAAATTRTPLVFNVDSSSSADSQWRTRWQQRGLLTVCNANSSSSADSLHLRELSPSLALCTKMMISNSPQVSTQGTLIYTELQRLKTCAKILLY